MPEPLAIYDGFLDKEDMAVILTHPLIGYYRRDDGKVGSYRIWHDRPVLHPAAVHRSSFAVLEDLGLINNDTKPHSAILQQQSSFIIKLPPHTESAIARSAANL